MKKNYKLQIVFGLLFLFHIIPVSAQIVESFTLVNASSNDDILTISNGQTINLSDLSTTNLNIRANTSPDIVGSLVFDLNGQSNYQIENMAPYALAGDNNGDYNAWSLGVGSFALSATPYSGSNGSGTQGSTSTINFSIIDQQNSGAQPPSNIVATALSSSEIKLSWTPPADGNDYIIERSLSPNSGFTQYDALYYGYDEFTYSNLDPSTTYYWRMATNLNGETSGYSNVTGATTFSDGTQGTATVTGELKKWHKVTLTFDGPMGFENATENPFLDYRLEVTFEKGSRSYTVPGYFAADGNASETSADNGNKWRVHFAPDAIGTWNWSATFRTGANIAINDDPNSGTAVTLIDGLTGTIEITDSDKTGRDHRGKGRLNYVGEHYLQFAETGEYFLKQGADAPENLLAYDDFDGNFKSDGQRDQYIKSWAPHAGDWNSGDPSWQGGKGTELIGALNYLASEGMNAFSFLTMNIGGDDRNVFPYTNYNERLKMDVSRLDQWEIIFEHADELGLYLHFKTQETENDQLLDGGELGVERKLYYRELIARFGHHLALNWNIGEENTNTDAQRKAFAQYFYDHDPYQHHIVIHTYPGQKNSVYTPLLGSASQYTGASLQTSNMNTSNHSDVVKWVNESASAGKKWVVAIDEPGNASDGLVPDAVDPTHDEPRKNALWGTLVGGGAGNEYYFGYQHAHSDLTCEDFRSRDDWWDVCRYALQFFENNNIPFWEMQPNDDLTSSGWALAKEGESYVVFLPSGGTTDLTIANNGTYDIRWFDPRNGGDLQAGSIAQVSGEGSVNIGTPPTSLSSDWAALVTLNTSDDILVTDLEFSNCPPTPLEVGTVYDLEVLITPSNATNQNITFTSSDGTSVDFLSGEFTASTPGSYTITATSFSDGSVSAQCVIEVVESLRNPYMVNEAETYDQQQGTRPGGSGAAVGYVNDGDWIKFNNMAFEDGPQYGTVLASSDKEGGEIEFRLDSLNGDLLAKVAIDNTSGWNSFENFDVLIFGDYSSTNSLGTRDLYLVFTGGSGYLFDLDKFVFNREEVVINTLAFNNCPETALDINEVYDLDVDIAPFNTTNKTVAFTSSDGISVDYLSGEFSASSPGTYTITATSFSDGAIFDQCVIEVNADEPIDAFSTIEGESFDNQNGTRMGGSGIAVGYIQNNDWLSFENVDFGKGANETVIRASSNTQGGSLELRLDALDGPLIGTVQITGTGGWSAFEEFSGVVNGAEGIHDLFLVFKGGNGYLYDVDWLIFNNQGLTNASSARIDQVEESISNNLDTPILSVYPNPSEGRFSLNLAKEAEVNIIDMTGRSVYLRKLPVGVEVINISDQKDGVFIISVGNDRIKIIKN